MIEPTTPHVCASPVRRYSIEFHGAGPVLMVLQGGAADADGSNRARRPARRSIHRRQLRSARSIAQPDRRPHRADQPSRTHADDASRVPRCDRWWVGLRARGQHRSADRARSDRPPRSAGPDAGRARGRPPAELLSDADRERLGRAQLELETARRTGGPVARDAKRSLRNSGSASPITRPDLVVPPPSPYLAGQTSNAS